MTTPHRILVVDDEADIRDTIVEVLEEHGYHAVGAADGAEALVRLRDPDDHWCVVLLDLMMPRMDGRSFRAEQLQDPTLSPIPVVVVSALPDVGETAKELQVAAHVSKPVSLANLVRIVERFCPQATG